MSEEETYVKIEDFINEGPETKLTYQIQNLKDYHSVPKRDVYKFRKVGVANKDVLMHLLIFKFMDFDCDIISHVHTVDIVDGYKLISLNFSKGDKILFSLCLELRKIEKLEINKDINLVDDEFIFVGELCYIFYYKENGEKKEINIETNIKYPGDVNIIYNIISKTDHEEITKRLEKYY